MHARALRLSFVIVTDARTGPCAACAQVSLAASVLLCTSAAARRIPWQHRCAARAYMRQSAAITSSAVQQRWLAHQAYQPMRGSWYMRCQRLVDATESVINNSQPLVKDNGHVRAAVEVQAYRASPKVVGASQSVWHIRGDGIVVGEGFLACGAGRISPCSPCAGTRSLRRRTISLVAKRRSVHLHSTSLPAVAGRNIHRTCHHPNSHTGRRAGMHACAHQLHEFWRSRDALRFCALQHRRSAVLTSQSATCMTPRHSRRSISLNIHQLAHCPARYVTNGSATLCLRPSSQYTLSVPAVKAVQHAFSSLAESYTALRPHAPDRLNMNAA